MSVLFGLYQAEEGEIRKDGKKVEIKDPNDANDLGIGMVHQHFKLIDVLTATENIILGLPGKLNVKEAEKKIKEICDRYGFTVDPSKKIYNMSVSEKQTVEIVKVLYRGANILILDEPTTSLSNEEINHLFEILTKMKSQGKSFIFISHKMPEIFTIADTYTVFRNGQYVSEGKIADTNATQMTSDMIGEAYAEKDVYEPRELGEVVMKVSNLYGEGFKNVSFELRRGEIFALTGLAGCGASELMHTLFGASPIEGGTIEVEGKNLNKGIKFFMKNKVAMLPSNRKEFSVVPDLSILENMYLAEHRISEKNQMISNKLELERYAKQKEALHIKADKPSDGINSLSGGNQQKVFLARWLNTEADVLLFDNPTQGVDVGAKSEIYQLIMQFAQQGKSIIINTLEIPEIMKVADSCAVLYDGEIVRVFPHDEINEKDVMLYSTNAINTEGGN